MGATVLIHAIGLDRHVWDFCADLDHAVTIDLPGHGTRPPLEHLSLAGAADDVAASMPPGSHVIGLSLGGMVAQHIAVRHPHLVRSLLLMCTRPASNRTEMQRRAHQTAEGGMASFIDEALPRWFTPEALGEESHPGVDYVRRRLEADDPAVIAAYWQAMADHDLTDALPGVTQPVTVVVGLSDRTSSARAGEAFAGLFPRGRLDLRPGPHMLPLEQPAAASGAVVDHLEWCQP